jgi:drug/metabolite transporter (DMT)-like permease
VSVSQLLGFLVCGLLGSLGHYCLTRGIREADLSATQTPKFLELVWAGLLGWAMFSEVPSGSTLAGGLVISAATLWLARRESRR